MKTRSWRRLDNAAKIFPPTGSARNPHVFRFACELHETVREDLLQQALDATIDLLPVYRVVMKKGLFWYFFEESPLRPVVSAEHRPVCSPLYHPDRKTLLFSVTYCEARINLEIYHALADGTGALQFLRTLVLFYLKLAHPGELDGLQADMYVEPEQGNADSFEKYYQKGSIFKTGPRVRAFKVRGEHLPYNGTGVIEGLCSAQALIAKSKALGVTVTEFVTALLMCAIHDTMPLRDEKKPVVATIPVNLRNYFSSYSIGNFFGVVRIGHNFATEGKSLEDVAAQVHTAFARELAVDHMRERMNHYSRLEHSMLTRFVPLVIKRPSMRYAARLVERGVTAAVSNLGVIAMPAEAAPYIRLFDVFNSTDKLQLCLCTFGDAMVLSISSGFASRDVQRSFFRALTGMGLSVTISTNLDEGSALP